ncbi:MAG: ATP-dependent zinc metalloprotease FtsH [Candidatus Caenarcaniphilales bacterium]|nr:ATP-dependent zinc metalloprotease FtsH [Candidatus Caenarcaniphilales bacterium]
MKNVRSNLPILLISILALIVALSFGSQKDSDEITYSNFRKIAFKQSETVEKAFIEDNGNTIRLVLKDGKKKFVNLPKSLSGQTELATELDKAGIETSVKDSKTGDFLFILLNFGPLLLLLPLLFIMMRGLQAGGGQAFNFIKSKAKLLGEQKTKITFSDVAGVEEAKEELKEVVEFLKDGDKFRALGAKIPKGVLLVGPPGTGKTLLAKAIAGEANVPFFTISGSDFVEMFVGVGASRVRDLFEQARKQAPCIIFVDEIDAVGRQRGATVGGHDEREQTLNQLLVEMDGFDSNNSSVIILAATNRPDILDSALTRPGRFDRQVVIDYPDLRGREEILKVHAQGKPLAGEVDLRVLAKRTPGFTGAQLANFLNEGALIAARKDKKQIENEDFDEAIDKVIAGPKKALWSPFKEREMTAYHETGHALLAFGDDYAMPLHKLSIIPRGMALGVTWYVPEDERNHITKNMLLSRVKTALGGRAAEEIIFGDVTAGAANDLQYCTKIARKMVTQFGMSELGPVAFGKDRETFLGDFGHVKDYSEDIAKQIDEKVQEIINHAYLEAKRILSSQREIMDAVVLELLDKETLDREEVERIIKEVQEKTFNFEQARERIKLLKEKIETRDAQHQSKMSLAA